MFDDVLREIELLKKLNHPNIIKMFEVIEDDVKEKLYMGKLLFIIDSL
jgi:serine/threonine protein kinase